MRTPRIEGCRCNRGHVHLTPHERCPECGALTRGAGVPAAGRLLLVTTVRVSGRDHPWQLGVVRAGRTRCICHLEGPVRGTGYDRVILARRGDRLVARPHRRAGRRARRSASSGYRRRYGSRKRRGRRNSK